MSVKVCVFDAYGTLFDVNSAARRSAEQPGRQDLAAVWEKLATDWRAKQLQYTWLRAVTGDHTSFWEVTENGLDWAMEASGLEDAELREELLALYWELAAYKEVPRMLAELKAAGFKTAILSNGSPDMLEGAIDFSGIGEWLDATLSVEDVGVFKPARAVYDMVGIKFGTAPDEVLFMSSNGWDAASAASYGFTTVWVNRAGDPMDRLPGKPHHVLNDLSTLPTFAQSL
ncbi:MAG: haloacid dehalogenase type II [Silicimonas sp.]|nr:haloacid dehalogenase type II [Silicimonas sp.]